MGIKRLHLTARGWIGALRKCSGFAAGRRSV